jgi:carbonic anhydrase
VSRRALLFGVPAAAAVLASPSLRTSAEAAQSQLDVAHQSPIDIRTGHAVTNLALPALHVHYPTSIDLAIGYQSRDSDQPGGCENRTAEETIVAAIPAGAAWVTVGGVRYDLVNFHFHTRSEHRLNGHQYALEQHFVHSGPNGEKLVVALFITTGGPGGTLQDRVLATVPMECDEDVHLPRLNLAAALPYDLSTYRYDGSLTTAPYTEPVSWLVLAHHHEILPVSLEHFQSRFPDGDSRPLQPLNGRTVQYRPQH